MGGELEKFPTYSNGETSEGKFKKEAAIIATSHCSRGERESCCCHPYNPNLRSQPKIIKLAGLLQTMEAGVTCL
jgi:hypothetical protein